MIKNGVTIGTIAMLGSIALAALSAAAADKPQKLTGPQILAGFTGMEFTDEAHWGEVYEGSGKVTTSFDGHKTVGTWRVKAGKLCLVFPKGSDGISDCYEVWRIGQRVELRESGSTSGLEGVLRKPVKGK